MKNHTQIIYLPKERLQQHQQQYTLPQQSNDDLEGNGIRSFKCIFIHDFQFLRAVRGAAVFVQYICVYNKLYGIYLYV